ncbi:MAG: hypothetical protein HY913_05950 [Desulfomonile tiedjei]|nr:hypothetical protein [Desulfomonile tiedjei]
MKASGLLLGCFLVFVSALASSPIVLAADQKSPDDLLLAAFEAEKDGGNSVVVMEKFQEVIKADPENYYALIKLGLMQMGEGKKKSKARLQETEATKYFLRAALARPTSPEAYLYLAQLNYGLGYIPEGDQYLNMSRSLDGHIVYDEVCLAGWRYEDTGNYFAAVMTYAPAALSRDSRFKGDPYLMKRLYMSALLSPPPYDWALLVTKLMIGPQADQIVEGLKKLVNEFLLSHPRFARQLNSQMIVNYILRILTVQVLGRAVNLTDKVPDRHELPQSLHKLFFCSPDEIPRQRFSDPYEAFVKASPGTPEDHKRVLAELKSLKENAVTATASIRDDEERAKELFIWLKKNALRDYHAFDGMSAKSVVDDHKYQCLSGSILYTLIARDAKLDVKGFLIPGHAYAVLNKEKQIRIETTAEEKEGFDFDPAKAAKRSREQDRAVYRSAFDSYGVISDPMKLIAYQFSNAASQGIANLVLNKYEPLFRKVLENELGLGPVAQTESIEMWRRYGQVGYKTKRGVVRVPTDSPQFSTLIRSMAVKDENFREELIKQLDQNIEMIKVARGMAPFEVKFRHLIDNWTRQAAIYELVVALAAAEDREKKRLAAKVQAAKPEMAVAARPVTADAAKAGPAEEEKIKQEEQQSWNTEKQHWLRGLKRLSDAVKQYPCSEPLQKSLKQVYSEARAEAVKRQDGAAIDALNALTRGLLAPQSSVGR